MTTTLHPDAAALVTWHNMQPHPEGGFFVETFRSRHMVDPGDGRGLRPAITNILFLLDASVNQGISRLHRVHSDEVWHFLAGAPLTLTQIPPALSDPTQTSLNASNPTLTVPASEWQAAQTEGPWTLVACSVGPGFDFEDFSMMKDDSETTARVLETFSHLKALV